MSTQEKILNTRIRSKIDTLDNWNNSTLPLLAGEIAIAIVPATEENGLTDPVCIIRIGEDGIKPFSQLKDALHAKAIDVLPICKDSNKLKEFILDTVTNSEIIQQLGFLFGNLTVEDTAVEGQYVTAVNQKDGQITVSRTNFPDFLKNIKITIEKYKKEETDIEKDCIILRDGDKIISYVDASSFIKDGMLNTVTYDEDTNELVFTWNTDSGVSEPIKVGLGDLIQTYSADNGIEIVDGVIKLNAQASGLLTTSVQGITAEGKDAETPSGIVVTKEEKSQTYNIAIDDSVTFIFDCGNAETNI